MISKTGALWFESNTPKDTIKICKQVGYHKCTQEQYKAKRLEQQKKERKEERKAMAEWSRSKYPR
jgi:hypothetical protein